MAPVVDCLAVSCLDNGEPGSGMEDETTVVVDSEVDAVVVVDPSTRQESDDVVVVGDGRLTPGIEEELLGDFKHDPHKDSEFDSGGAADEDVCGDGF